METKLRPEHTADAGAKADTEDRSRLRTALWRATARLPVLLLPITGIAATVALLPIASSSGDMVTYFLPWMDAVQDGGLTSLSSEFADYTPPYIYLMYFGSWLVPLVGPPAAIKLLNLPFITILSLAIYQIVLLSSRSRGRAATAGAAVWVLPTPLVNAFAWGQTDCVVTSFLALFVLFTIKRAPVAAVSFFGVALAFKLQAIFLLPLLLYSILAKQMRVWHLLLAPLLYLLMMVPAAIAGRPWFELVTIHVAHVQRFSELAIHAPNLWRIVGGLELVEYRTGLLIGCAAAGLAGAAIAISALRLQPSPRTIVLVAAVSSALMPYLLPRMHDRYFFVADIMTLTLALVVPRLWVIAVLFQVGSLMSYLPYFGLSGRASVYAVLPVTFGVGVLVLEYMRAQLGSSVSIKDLLCTGGRASARSRDAPRR
jgi:Gpi18-like mannosyltransferase